MAEGYKTMKQAINAAKKHSKTTDAETFVFHVFDSFFGANRFDWCEEWEYRAGPYQWVREQNVVWNSCDGYY